MNVQVRRIRADEGSTLQSVRLRALANAPYAFATTLAEARQRSDAQWAAEARHRSADALAATFFAENEGAVVGMAGVYIHDREGELVALWTAPELRRVGIAHQIIETIVEWCRSAGAVQLWTAVAGGNDTARTVYEDAGFVATDVARPMGVGGERTEWRFKRDLAIG